MTPPPASGYIPDMHTASIQTPQEWLDALRFDDRGLVPVVAQDAVSGEILMLAYANRDALERTAASGRAHYWSRSRQQIWRKGDTSGHEQHVREIRVDCDADTVLYQVIQVGAACHTGEATCFHQRVTESGAIEAGSSAAHVLGRVERVIAERARERPDGSYTTYLLEKGIDKILKKIGEESTEVVVAAKNGDNVELTAEVSDLLFHLLVLLRERDLPLEAVWSELERRFGGPSKLPSQRSTTHTHS